MKIAFVDLYRENANPHKDPVSTPLGLQAQGHDVLLVSRVEGIHGPFQIAGLPVVPAAQMTNGGWRRNGFDAVVAISRFDPSMTPLLLDVKASGIPLVVKGDTDGTVGYPLKPNYLRMLPLLARPGNILRHLKWRLPIRHWVGQKLAHIRLADRVIVESPGAAANLVQVLRYWGRERDVTKLRVLTNHVSRIVVEMPAQSGKQREIIAIGRWEDALCKGADILAATITQLLAARDDYKVTIVGTGLQEVRRHLEDHIIERVSFFEEMSFKNLQKLVANARILLVPSRFESFSFVTAEALCAGTSIVATPIESLIYMTGGGAWGTLARNFTASAVTAALLCEIENWENNRRDPLETSSYWRNRLGPDAAVELWTQLLEELHAKRGQLT